MRIGLAVALSLASLLAGSATAKARGSESGGDYGYRILANPTSGDEFAFRGALHDDAQGRANGMFSALASLLGGTAPQINFVQPGSDLTPNHMSTNLDGALKGQINMDPLTVNALIHDGDPIHSVVVNQVPHEMAHTRQTPQTLADLISREGGAQAFADLEAGPAAKAARIPYQPGNYDGSAADYVKQIRATKPPSWITAGQFGR